jgi:hypothetical protein
MRARNPTAAFYYAAFAGFGMRQGCISVVRNDSVVATKSKSAVTFYIDGVARFTFFCSEDRFDRSNKLVTG